MLVVRILDRNEAREGVVSEKLAASGPVCEDKVDPEVPKGNPL
jgi:hypothetical protein